MTRRRIASGLKSLKSLVEPRGFEPLTSAVRLLAVPLLPRARKLSKVGSAQAGSIHRATAAPADPAENPAATAAQLAMPISPERDRPGRSHSFSFDQRRRPETLRTAMATAFFCRNKHDQVLADG